MSMLYSGRTMLSVRVTGMPVKALTVITILSVGTMLQACSASRDQGDGGSWKLWGNDKPQESAATKPPSAFDRDGPPARPSEPAYRGGRDPVTGRANDWPPAAPPPVDSTALAPVPQYSQLPPPAYPPPPYAPPHATSQAAARPPLAVAPATPTSVEVRQGDTLYRIAKTYNVTVPALMQSNGLTSESIRPGQRLNIPAH
jgi:hypothetical protein